MLVTLENSRETIPDGFKICMYRKLDLYNNDIYVLYLYIHILICSIHIPISVNSG